jgi:cell division protein FtsQ
MHQLIDKKNKIIIYLFFLFILSTTSGKFIENQKSYPSSINQINIEGLSEKDRSKISNELKNLFYGNILLVKKVEIQRILDKYNII